MNIFRESELNRLVHPPESFQNQKYQFTEVLDTAGRETRRRKRRRTEATAKLRFLHKNSIKSPTAFTKQ